MIVLDTDVLVEIFDKHSGKGDQVLRRILRKTIA
jgi:predicted nucleic acid-binding protein